MCSHITNFMVQGYLGGLERLRNKMPATPWRRTGLKTTFTNHEGKSYSEEDNHV